MKPRVPPIHMAYCQLLKWGKKVESYTVDGHLTLTLYEEPDCVVNEKKPHSYKVLTKYTLDENPKIETGYEKDGAVYWTMNITHEASYFLRSIRP